MSGIPIRPEPAFNGNEKKKPAFLGIGLLILVAVFHMARGELAKIYPLLMEKGDR